MLKKIYVFLLLVLTLLSITYIKAKNNTLPLFGKVIYLDPGHGGLDPGAMYGGVMEKDINLEITKEIEKKLTSLGAIVYLTRYDDYDLSVIHTNNRKRSDLSRRANIINKSKCDIYLSIHLNAENTGLWKGAQVFYNNNLKGNKKIAEIFQTNFKKNLNSKRKAKVSNNLYLEKRVNRPGVLLELGFLSNQSERYLLTKKYYQEKIATIISDSLITYFK